MSTERAVNRPDRSKPARVPMHQRNRLSFSGVDDNFVYRVFNDVDEGERIKSAQAAGYEFVESQENLGDVRVADATKLGAKVSKHVGNGVRGYLMRIPKNLYEEDQAAKQLQVASTEAAMKPDKAKNQYGDGLSNT